MRPRGGRAITGPIRVLHVIPRLGPGGADRLVQILAQKIDNREFEILVCVLVDDRAFPGEFESGVSVLCLGQSLSLSNTIELSRSIRALWKVIKEFNPRIIHSHLWHASRLVALALVPTNLPHIVHIHDTWPPLADGRVRSRLKRKILDLTLLRRNTFFIAVSDYVRDYTCSNLHSTRGQIRTVRNGVDIHRFRPRPTFSSALVESRPVIITMIAWFFDFKGHANLIQAVNLLKNAGINFLLQLVGDGPTICQCRRLVEETGLVEKVRFLGVIDDVRDLLAASDVFVLPSEREGLPISILEAMAMGISVVATRVGGIPEVIQDGETGLLIPPNNSLLLFEALMRLIRSPELRKKIGDSAIESVRNSYSADAMADSIEATYRNILHIA